MQNLKYKIALGLIPNVGPITAKTLISYTGSPEAIFKEPFQKLIKIPGIGEITAKIIIENRDKVQEAEEEVDFILNNNIKTIFYPDSDYPELLRHCSDAPIMLFYKGNLNINGKKSLSVVGTRNASPEGKENCDNLIKNLSEGNHNPIIVSGLAYGIDICAHKAALNNNLETIAVLGHGLNKIYPTAHAPIASEIINQGAIITEFTSKAKFERQNFLRRNRIIAGISQATIVVESAIKGGSLTTADIANSYDREVFAFPGRVSDKYSQGCNMLIKQHRAYLIENSADLEYNLSWEQNKETKITQKALFVELSETEKTIITILQENKKPVIDFICKQSQMTMNKVSSTLLELEFKGLVRCLPGKIYETTGNIL
jgi:DNA processing protein